jgi:NADH:ubiquinone oxidoreductase subunit 2 (subunit N)
MVGVLAALHVSAGEDVPWGMMGVLIYIAAYLLMNLGVFAIVVAVGKRLGSDLITDYTGLMKRSPFFASALAVFFASLAGVPPTAGFLGKFFIFGGAIKVGILGSPELVALAVIGVVNSVISVYYYFNVVRLMFFAEPGYKAEVRGSRAVNTVVAVLLALTLLMIVFAKPVSDLASKSVYASSAQVR